MFSLGKKTSFLGCVEEPVVELVKWDLSIAILIKFDESKIESFFVKFVATTDLTVELSCDFVDFWLFEEAWVINVKSEEELSNDFCKFVCCDRHIF